MSKITIYDPPSGWLYGFPKQYLPKEGETLEDTLRRDGYPEHEIKNTGAKYVRFWDESPEQWPVIITSGLIDCQHKKLPEIPPSFKPFQSLLQIKVKRLTPTSKLPTKAYPGDLGWDIYADARYTLHHGGPVVNQGAVWLIAEKRVLTISTGIAVELPKGWGAFFKPRSSQGKNGEDVYGGVLDNGYRGELRVSVFSLNTMVYKPGEKIGQMVLIPCPESEIVEVNELSESERGKNGFGSTGK